MTDPHTESLPDRAKRSPGQPRLVASRASRALVAAAFVLVPVAGPLARQAPSPSPAERAAPSTRDTTFSHAQRLFYNARYEEAASTALALRSPEAVDLASYELRTSALLFQLKALLERPGDKDGEKIDKKDALKTCASCPALMTAFFEDIQHGTTIARGILKAKPGDQEALFFLGKLDLNYIWLQLGPLGRKTGWDEYWEARRSLDAVLKAHPQHVRAMTARAWIDYIVDTKMPWGTRWVLGGGSKKRALVALRTADGMEADFFTHAEATFALWEIEVRERNMAQATEIAGRLARDFPDNREVAAFVEARKTRPVR